ncbi:MAG: hypothetical protein Q9225_000405 [Loekoesia sp. 1 TL-2023]
MLEDPEAGKYVETLKITRKEIEGSAHPLADLADPEPSITTDSHDYLQIFHTYFDGLKAQSSLHCDRVQALLSDSQIYLKEDIVPLLRDELSEKTPAEATTILILLQLSNLRKLILRKMLQSVEMRLLSNMILRASSLPADAVKPFGRLTEVEIGSNGRRSSLRGILMWLFCCLPSIRIVRGICLNTPEVPRLGCLNQVESLQFHDCDTRFCDGIRALGKPKRLKTFYFTTTQVVDGRWEPFEVGEWLRAHSTRTLEELTFYHNHTPNRAPTHNNHFIGSLRPFENLRVAKIMSTAFICWNDDDEDYPVRMILFRLIDMLPASLEKLVMVGKGPVDIMNRLFMRMGQLKQARLPNLREIVFEEDPHLNMEMNEELKAAGVELTIVNVTSSGIDG